MALVTSRKGEASATTNMTTTGLSVTLDGSPASGELMLAVFTCRGGSNRTITPPSGWTLWPSTRVNNGTNTATALYYKTAGGGESTTQGAWTLDTAAAHSALVIQTFTGHDATSGTSFIVSQGTNSGSGTSQGVTVSSLTSGTTYATWGGWGNNNQTTYTKDAAHTESNQINTTGGSNITVLGAYELSVTGSTSYTRTAVAGSSGNWAASLGIIALAPTSFSRSVPATAVLLKSASRSVPSTAVLLKSLSRTVPAKAVVGHTALLRPSDRNQQIGYSWTTDASAIDDIYTAVDESSTNDSDFITNNRTGTDEERTGFGLEMMPESAGYATIMRVILHYRAKSASSSGKIRPFFRHAAGVAYLDTDPGSDVTLSTSLTDYTWDITALRDWSGETGWTLQDINYGMQIGFYKADTANNAVTVTQAWLEVIYATGDAPFRPVPVNAHVAWYIVESGLRTNTTFDTANATVTEDVYAYAAFEVTVTAMAFNTVAPHLHIIISRVDLEDNEYPVAEGEVDDVGTFMLGLPTVNVGQSWLLKLTCVVEGDVTFQVLVWEAGYLLADNGV